MHWWWFKFLYRHKWICTLIRCTKHLYMTYINVLYILFTMYRILNTFIIHVLFASSILCHWSKNSKPASNPTCRCASPADCQAWSTKMWLIKFYCLDYFFQLPNVVCWSNADTSLFSIVLLVYHHWNHALPPAVSSYACCFSLHVYTIIYLYTYTYQSYSAPSCQSNQADPHKPPLQSPILPAIEHRDWPRRCERHLNDLKFETLEIGGNRISWITSIALTSWVTSVNF